METYTPVIKKLQDLNQEIRQRLSSMHSCTEQEIKNLDKWLVEARSLAENLENASLLINQHLRLFEIELQKQQRKVSSKELTEDEYI